MELQNSDEDVNEIPWKVTWDFLLQSIAAFLKEFAIFFKKTAVWIFLVYKISTNIFSLLNPV